MIRLLKGKVKLTRVEPPDETILSPARPGIITPEQPHFVTPLGPMKMQVDFYDQPPPDG